MNRRLLAGLATATCAAVGLTWWLAIGDESVPVAGTPRGDDARCEKVLDRLPRDLMGESRRSTTNPGTAAWGGKGQVRLRCGLPPTAPSPNQCFRVSGADWVVDEPSLANGVWKAVSYGTDPAVQVQFPGADASGSAWVEVSEALKPLKSTGRRCMDNEDVPLPSPDHH